MPAGEVSLAAQSRARGAQGKEQAATKDGVVRALSEPWQSNRDFESPKLKLSLSVSYKCLKLLNT